MRNQIDTLHTAANHRWPRLGASFALAFLLALVLLFMPIAAGGVVHVTLPGFDSTLDAAQGASRAAQRTVDLSMPFGSLLVRATNGLTITKTASPSSVDQGGLITYTLTITNNTGMALTDITVTDTVPAGAQCEDIVAPPRWLVNGSENCQDDGQAFWLLLPPTVGGTLDDGNSVALRYTVRVDEPLPNQSSITNEASSYAVRVVSPTTFIDSGKDTVTTLVNAPEWQIAKSVIPTPIVEPGDFLTYTLTITNSGAITTSGDFQIVDALPAHTTFYTASGSYLESSGLITWTVSTPLGPEEVATASLVVQVDSPLANSLSIVNGDYRVLGGDVYSQAVGSPAVSLVSSQAELEASKAAHAASVEAGEALTYTLTVTNLATANGPAEDVVVSDPLPDEVLYEQMGFLSPATGTVEHPALGVTGAVTWTLDSMLWPGESMQLYVVGRVTSPLTNGTSLSNTCSVTAANALAPSLCPPVAVTVTSAPELSLDKSVTQTSDVSPGGTVTYTIVLTNTGNETANGVTVADTLGPGFVPGSVLVTGVSVPGWPTYGSLATQTVVFTAHAPLLPGVHYNQAITATYAATQATASNRAPITIGTPDLRIRKSVTPASVIAGDLLTYTIAYSNAADALATGVRITDTLGANLTFAGGTPAPDVSAAPQFAWGIGALSQADGEQVITITARVAGNTPNGTLVSNSALMSSAQEVGASAEPITASVLAPELHVAKSDAGYDPIDAGAVLTYTITYSNTGGAPAHNVRITDTLDADVSFLRASVTPTFSSPPEYVWLIPTLAEGSGPQPLTVAVRVDQPLPDGTQLANSVNIQGDEASTDSDAITTTVRSAPIFQVSKTASPGVARPGQPLTYTIVFTNVGNATATGVRITDSLDSNLVWQDSDPMHTGINGNELTWNWPGGVALDDPQTITVSTLVTSPLANGTLLWNTVDIDSTQGATGTASLATLAQTATNVDLRISKSVVPLGTITANEWLTYTLTFTNAGDTPANNVVITDTLPVSLTDVISSATTDITFEAGSLYVWHDNLVLPENAEVGVITITGRLLPAPWPSTGAWLTNTAVITTDDPESQTSDNTDKVASLAVPGDPYTVTVTPGVAQATAGTNVPVTASVTDRYGNPVRDGTSVTFARAPAGSSVTPASRLTSGGIATTTLYSALSATVTVTATAEGVADSAQVIYRPAALDRFVVGVASPQTAGVAFSAVITAVDRYGNVVDFNNPVSLQDVTGTLLPTNSPPLVNGRVTASLTVTQATPADVITATWGITPVMGVSNSFAVQAGAPSRLVVSPAASSMRVCQTSAVSTTVTDPWGNLIPNQSLGLSVIQVPGTNGAASLLPSTGSTGPAGTFVSTLRAMREGQVRIYGEKVGGTPNNASAMPTMTFAEPAVPSSLSLDVTPNPLLTGGATAVVTATVADCAGPSAGQVVTFTLSSSSLAWFPGPAATFSAVTNASGVATASFTSNSTPAGGTLIITGTGEGVADTIALDVELPAEPSLTMTKTANPPGGNVRPGYTLVYTLVARNVGDGPATGVVISDTLPAGVGLVSRTTSSGTVISNSPLRVTADALPAGQAITVTAQVTVTSGISGTLLANRASVDSNETQVVFSSLVSHRVTTGTQSIRLPFVLKIWSSTQPPAPTDTNLVVDDIRFVDSAPANDGDRYHVQVIVRNAGTASATDDFWVDLYLNPSQTPQPNQPWQNLSQSGERGVSDCPTDPTCYGRAWLVTSDMAPGEAITLTTQMPPDERYERWPADGAPYARGRHNPLVALVDSWGASYGAIYENNETDNLSGAISGSGAIRAEQSFDLPYAPAWAPGSQRPSLPAPHTSKE